jgi:hypothetical protein
MVTSTNQSDANFSTGVLSALATADYYQSNTERPAWIDFAGGSGAWAWSDGTSNAYQNWLAGKRTYHEMPGNEISTI